MSCQGDLGSVGTESSHLLEMIIFICLSIYDLDGIVDFCRQVVHAVHWRHMDLWQKGDDFRVDDKDQPLTALHNLMVDMMVMLRMVMVGMMRMVRQQRPTPHRLAQPGVKQVLYPVMILQVLKTSCLVC